MRDLQLELKYWEYHRHDDRVVLPVHAHRFWQLNLAEEGHTLIHIGGEKPFRLEAGEFLFVPPGIPHKLEFDRRIPFVGFSFKFELHELEREKTEVIRIPASPETRGILRALRELFPAGEGFSGEKLICGDSPESLVVVEGLLLGVVRRFLLAEAPEESPLLGRLRQLLGRQPGHALTVREFARECRLSPGHLSTLCKAETGLPAKALIDRERARLARHLLEYSSLSIKEIAQHLGFSSPFAFSGFFRLHHGVAPRDFRKGV